MKLVVSWFTLKGSKESNTGNFLKKELQKNDYQTYRKCELKLTKKKKIVTRLKCNYIPVSETLKK